MGFRDRLERFQARQRGMSVDEYRRHKTKLRQVEKDERRKYEEGKIKRKYERRRREDVKRARQRGGRAGGALKSLLDIGENAARNFGVISGSTGKPKRRRKTTTHVVRVEVVAGKPKVKKRKKRRKRQSQKWTF